MLVGLESVLRTVCVLVAVHDAAPEVQDVA